MDSSAATDRFDERFLKLFTELSATYLALVWEEELGKNSPAEWLEIVKQFTLPAVIELLGRHEPPNFNELVNLAWIDTDDAGTYLHLLSPERAGHHNHLYVGSATGPQATSKGGSKGLRARRERRERPDIHKIEPGYHHNLMNQVDVPRTCHWATLVLVPWPEDPTEDEVMQIRIICRLAESMYTAWLAGYWHKAHADLVGLCPYPRGSLNWYGDCTHDALLEGIGRCVDPQLREERRKRGLLRVKDRQRVYKQRYRAKLEATAPEQLRKQMAHHSQQTNAQTAIKLANMPAEEIKEFKSKAAARNRKYRGIMVGERKEEFQATNRERTRKRRAEGLDDKTAVEKEEYSAHRKNLYSKKKEGMTADELKAFNAKSAAKSKAQRARNKLDTPEKKEARLATRRARTARRKGTTAVDDDSADDDEEEAPRKRIRNSAAGKENIPPEDEQED